MKFADVLPGLLAGRRARMRKRALYDAEREYVRLGDWRKDELEIVLEYDNVGGRPSQYIRPFLLTRNNLERDDWELIDDAESETTSRETNF